MDNIDSPDHNIDPDFSLDPDDQDLLLDSEESPEQQSFAGADFLPNVLPNTMAVPLLFGLSNLFPHVGGSRWSRNTSLQLLEGQEIDTMKGLGEIRYSGPQLQTIHGEVLLNLVRSAQKYQHSVLEPVRTTMYNLCKEMKRSPNPHNYDTFKGIISDLEMGKIEIRNEKIIADLVQLWENRDLLEPAFRTYLEKSIPLAKDLAAYKAGKRFLTVKLIRNVAGELGDGDKASIELDPYMVLLFGESLSIFVDKEARYDYQKLYTPKVVTVIRWQKKSVYSWSESMWRHQLLAVGTKLSPTERIRFRKKLHESIQEAEEWGEILPGTRFIETSEVLKDEFGQPKGGRPRKSFKTERLVRLSPQIRNRLVDHKYRVGNPEWRLLAHLNRLALLNTEMGASSFAANMRVGHEELIRLFIDAPRKDPRLSEMPLACSALQEWFVYLSERIDELVQAQILAPIARIENKISNMEGDMTFELVDASFHEDLIKLLGG